jgi:glycosyltransferase involved in cell wall biosynthesis
VLGARGPKAVPVRSASLVLNTPGSTLGFMTLITWINYIPAKVDCLVAPCEFRCGDVSVIIPVKDNQAGITQFLSALFETHSSASLPFEVIIVDNRSAVAIEIPTEMMGHGLPIRLIQCRSVGPASARNAGAAIAQGRWLLFVDSDCEPTASFIAGYGCAMNGALGYAGNVRSAGGNRLSRYYESQDILVPPRVMEDRPQYLITANALVWRRAFERIGGFDEGYSMAGGEDVDLGFRLSQLGNLSYAPASVVLHDFSDGYGGFLRRFVRYGRGNRRLSRCHGISLRPKPFLPTHLTPHNLLVAFLQFLWLSWGYWTAPR